MPIFFNHILDILPDPDDEYSTWYTSSSAVTGAHSTGTQWVSGSTETIRISAIPSISYVFPEKGGVWEDMTIAARAKVGFPCKFALQGNNFHYHEHLTLYISAAPGVYTNTLSAITAFDLFKDAPTLSAMYPAFSGFRVDDFAIVNQYTITLLFSATQAPGYADIIVANKAGYSTLYGTLSTRLVKIDA